jgi:hypothetical protein
MFKNCSLELAPLLLACSFGLGCSANATAITQASGGGQGGSSAVTVGTGGFITSASGGSGVMVGVGGTVSVGDGEPFGCATSLSGTVYDPAGKLPLYNVVVYVPSQPLAPISEGASCQTCDGNFSGRPIAAALSDAAGKFTLDLSKVPRAATIPLVIQVGKWRREISAPGVAACAQNTIADGDVRLPRDRSEGNLPRIAVVRGGSDALECLFRKIGISDSEFAIDTGDGRVTLYASDDAKAPAGTKQLANGTAIPAAGTLYGNYDKLKSYDVLFLACEGNGRGSFDAHSVTEFSNMQKYADEGGRIFGSHYHNYWVRPDKFDESKGLAPYPAVAKFASSQHGFDADVTGDIDATFPKGEAFRDWLVNVGASTTPGKLLIHDGEHTVDATLPGVSQPWVTVNDPSGHAGVVQYFSFTTPVGAAECGRMVFSDLHVASGTGDSGKLAFPTGCVSLELSPQEKALAFMLFDLSSCVQPEDQPVVPPTIIR